MLRKLSITLSACLLATSAFGAGACKGKGCRYTCFEKDTQGCLTVRNTGREDIQVTVYTAGSGAISLRVMGGHTETVYRISRNCVPADDYVRADSELAGGVFAPPI